MLTAASCFWSQAVLHTAMPIPKGATKVTGRLLLSQFYLLPYLLLCIPSGPTSASCLKT